MKQCTRCREFKPETEFYKNRSMKSGLASWCKTCAAEYSKQNNARIAIRVSKRNHITGRNLPMDKNRQCPMFLGIYVAERVLSLVFKNVKRMTINNKGFDFICGRGYKIDVKSACRRARTGHSNSWSFRIGKNKIADYFLCMAFDDRESVNPEHLWLIPGRIVNNQTSIDMTESMLRKWSKYEQPLDNVIQCCNVLKTDTT